MAGKFYITHHLILLTSLLCVPAHAEKAVDTETSRKPALSAIHNNDIRTIMRRLNALVYEREYTQLELDRLRRENLQMLVDAAADLIKISDKLPDLISDQEISSDEQITFKAMARQLHNEASQLLDSDPDISYHELNNGFQRLQQTCAACHNLFRDW